MKSAVFYEKNKLIIEDLPMPDVKENEVLIRVKACGICGTDVHIFEGDEGAAKTPPGTVLGHEFAGVVEKVGSNVVGISTGDRVCVDPNKLCGECYFCKIGTGHFCESMVGIGTTVNGGFSEYCAVPASQVYKINDNVSFSEAAMAEPISCCLHGIDMCDISCSDTVLIIGGGMIGMLMLQLAKLSGAARLIMLEPVEAKRELAKSLGADLCISPSENVKDVLKKNNIERITTVIECVGRPETMEQAIELAGKKSTVMLFGLTKPDDTIALKPFEIFKKEITLRASYINPYTQARAVELLNSKKIEINSLIFEALPLEKLPEILSDKAFRSKGKFIIEP